MTDIVERLRENSPEKPTVDRFEAADTIESLRQRVKSLEITTEIQTKNNTTLRQSVKELENKWLAEQAINLELEAEYELQARKLAALKGITAFNPNNAASNVQSGARHQTPLQDIYDTLYTSASSIPEGWQLVPVEPTPKMLIEAGPMTNYDFDAPGASPDHDHVEWYRAMLAAAPKPDTPQTCFSAGDMADAQAKAFREGVVSAQGDNELLCLQP